MPLIPKAGATNRLQVTSPVPIGSSAAARMDGETLANFGDTITNATINIDKFIKDTDEMKRQAQLDEIAENAELMAARAFSVSETTFKKEAGDDKLNVFVDAFAKEEQTLLNAVQDPEVKARASKVLAQARNRKLGDVQRSTAQAREEFIKGSRGRTVGMQFASVAQNPTDAVSIIARNQAGLEKVADTYNPTDFAKLQREEPKQLANAAIQSLINDETFGTNRFALAKTMANGELAGFLGEDVVKANETIDKARRAWRSELNTTQDRAEKQSKEAFSERSEEVTKGFLIEIGSSSSPITPPATLQKVRDAYSSGEIDEAQYQKIIKWRATSGATPGQGDTSTVVNYQKQIAAGNLNGIDNRIIDDVLAGNMTKTEGERLGRNVTIGRANKNQRNVDSTLRQALEEGDVMVREATAGQPDKVWAEVQGMYLDEIGRGQTPQKAAAKASKTYYTNISRTVYVDDTVLPRGMQQTAESMSQGRAQFDVMIKKFAASGNNKDKAKGVAAMKAFSQRQAALNVLKGAQ